MKKHILTIANLHVSVDTTAILKGVDFAIKPGSIHALMGPNGSGKSTLAQTLMGHPRYTIKQGSVQLFDTDLTALSADKRAQAGLFCAFQYPPTLSGVNIFTFLKEAKRALTGVETSLEDIYDQLCTYAQFVGLDEQCIYRNLNEGFSGGQRKRLELLQLLMLKPKVAILDEVDSGLDVDGLHNVARAVQHARTENPDLAILIITHYQRILEHIIPDAVHIMHEGKIIQSGNASLACTIDKQGYNDIRSL
ncbi:MAG: Fe-S cluster assembly ATPase SufC [Candidatus Babeliales bacterium]